MEMTWHRFAIAQFMPLSMPPVAPDPALLKTLPTKIEAL
ncbi:hypothetical protein BTZ20_2919 [Rhodococcus sp. MTM3W5.2]|nr:hypothetical protein BTZ20_2919 [Rhodococcus sp. MTM3W5.2]